MGVELTDKFPAMSSSSLLEQLKREKEKMHGDPSALPKRPKLEPQEPIQQMIHKPQRPQIPIEEPVQRAPSKHPLYVSGNTIHSGRVKNLAGPSSCVAISSGNNLTFI